VVLVGDAVGDGQSTQLKPDEGVQEYEPLPDAVITVLVPFIIG